MIYTEEQLFALIKPMIVSAMEVKGNSEAKAVHVTTALIRLIHDDREAHAKLQESL